MTSSEETDSVHSQPQSEGEGPTPLEHHVRLEVAQIAYENLLRGLPVDAVQQTGSKWRKRYLGKDWARRNEEQRLAVRAQRAATGQGAGDFLQASDASKELAMEMLWTGQHASALEDINCTRVRRELSQLATLSRRSEAGCRGACDGRGLEVLVAVLQAFAPAGDSEGAEVLRLCAKTLQQMFQVAPCLEALAELSAPKVPGLPGDATRPGWPFLHAVLAAYVQQDRAVAFELAKCLSQAAAANPVLQRELDALKTPAASAEHPDLYSLVHRAHDVTMRFIAEEGKPFPELANLKGVLGPGIE